jgi:hypothetical protein
MTGMRVESRLESETGFWFLAAEPTLGSLFGF